MRLRRQAATSSAAPTARPTPASARSSSRWTRPVLICRTSTDGPPHAGIAIMSMDTPGIEVQPIKDMTTNRHFLLEVSHRRTRCRRKSTGGRRGGASRRCARLEHEQAAHRPASSADPGPVPDGQGAGRHQRSGHPPGDRPARDPVPYRPHPGDPRGAQQAPAGFSATTSAFCTEHEAHVSDFVSRVFGAEATLWSDAHPRPAVHARLHDHGWHLERDAQHPRRTSPRPPR